MCSKAVRKRLCLWRPNCRIVVSAKMWWNLDELYQSRNGLSAKYCICWLHWPIIVSLNIMQAWDTMVFRLRWVILACMNVSHTNALKGQLASSPGQRPGYSGRMTFALKGQKNHPALLLLPFQGDPLHRRLPRALPWAGCSLPFQGVCVRSIHNLRNLSS